MIFYNELVIMPINQKCSHSLLLGVDPLKIQERNPYASSNPNPGTQKQDTGASRYALHLVT